LQAAGELCGDKVQREIYNTLLIALLVSIGCQAEPVQIQALLREELSECINEIATSVAKTSRMIREEFVSDDLQVMYVQPGQRFNSILMDAEEGEATPGVQAPVLGTVVGRAWSRVAKSSWRTTDVVETEGNPRYPHLIIRFVSYYRSSRITTSITRQEAVTLVVHIFVSITTVSQSSKLTDSVLFAPLK
jgi:hypothetical protein